MRFIVPENVAGIFYMKWPGMTLGMDDLLNAEEVNWVLVDIFYLHLRHETLSQDCVVLTISARRVWFTLEMRLDPIE